MIVVCGEALMDVFHAGDTATGSMLDTRIGGSPLNVAIGLARLGQPVEFFAAVGRGFLGERICRALTDEGVGAACLVRVAAPTTLGLVGLDANGVPDYAFYGERGADRQLVAGDLARVAAGAVYQFGSYAMVVEPAASTLRALVERERGTAALIAYDVNVRTNVEPDLERWRGVLDWMVPRVHLLKLSDEDLGRLYPGIAQAELAHGWLQRGVALVVVTRGKDGATGWTAHTRCAVTALATDVVDTVGAGDSFQAALLARLAERGLLHRDALRRIDAAALDDALRFAATAAAITCSRRGADLPRRSEVKASQPQV